MNLSIKYFLGLLLFLPGMVHCGDMSEISAALNAGGAELRTSFKDHRQLSPISWRVAFDNALPFVRARLKDPVIERLITRMRQLSNSQIDYIDAVLHNRNPSSTKKALQGEFDNLNYDYNTQWTKYFTLTGDPAPFHAVGMLGVIMENLRAMNKLL